MFLLKIKSPDRYAVHRMLDGESVGIVQETTVIDAAALIYSIWFRCGLPEQAIRGKLEAVCWHPFTLSIGEPDAVDTAGGSLC